MSWELFFGDDAVQHALSGQEFKLCLLTAEQPNRDKMIQLLQSRIRHTKRDIKRAMEELYVNKDPIKVGDRVEAPRHGRGTVLAIVGDNAWVQTEVRDYPLTFDVRKLKLVPKPRTGRLLVFDVVETNSRYGGPWHMGRHTAGVELTDEVRERLAGLL